MIYARYRDQGPKHGLFAAQTMSITMCLDQIHIFPSIHAYENAKNGLGNTFSGRESPQYLSYSTDGSSEKGMEDVFFFDENGEPREAAEIF